MPQTVGIEGMTRNIYEYYRLDTVWPCHRHPRQSAAAGKQSWGFILTILLGITGALLGGFFRHWLGLSGDPREYSWESLAR